MSNKIEFVVLGDVKDLENKLSGVQKSFDKLGKASGIALAGLTATTFSLINAYREEEQVINQLNQALKNNGNFTNAATKELQDYAGQLQDVSLFTDDQIIKAQALIAQYGFEGQVLKDVTKATLDLAQAKGMDLSSAADIVAKSIGTDTNALKRYGVEVEGVAGSTERANNFIRNSSRLFEGQAEAATKGYGALIQLKNSAADLGDEIAIALQPKILSITSDLKGMIDFLKKNPEFAKQAADLLVLGIQISAVGVGLSVLSKLWFQTTIAVAALNTQLAFLGGVQMLGLSTSIGVLVKNVGVLYPLLVLAGTAFAAWNLGKWIAEVTGLNEALSGTDGLLTKIFRDSKLAQIEGEQNAALAARGQTPEQIQADAAARLAALQQANQAEIDGQVAVNEVHRTLQEDKLLRMQEFQAQVALMKETDLAQELEGLTVTSDLTKTFEQQKTQILQDEMKKRAALREADKTNQQAALQFLAASVQAFGKESKATFFILQAIKAAEVLVNTAAADMNIAAVWAWNPPVQAALTAKNHVLGAISLATILSTTIAGSFAVGTPNVPKDMMANIHEKEMIIPATFSDAIRSGDLTLSGGGGGGAGVYVDLRGAQFNNITDMMVEQIFTRAAENMTNRTLAPLPVV